jgi:hypothetical protein
MLCDSEDRVTAGVLCVYVGVLTVATYKIDAQSNLAPYNSDLNQLGQTGASMYTMSFWLDVERAVLSHQVSLEASFRESFASHQSS